MRGLQVGGKRTTASLVEDRLRHAVLGGELPPGSRINLRRLSESYNVGTIPLREALSRLSASGLVTIEDQKGFRVAEISREDAIDIHKQRADLEVTALRASIETGGIRWETDVISAHHAMVRRQEALGTAPLAMDAEWESYHTKFHLALVSGCDSKWLKLFIQILIDHSIRYRQFGAARISGPEAGVRNVAQEHSDLMQAALNRDADLACALLRSHYERTVDLVVGLLDGK